MEGDEGGKGWERGNLIAKSWVRERTGWNGTKLERYDRICRAEMDLLSLRWFLSSSTRTRSCCSMAERRDNLDPATTEVLTINMAARMRMRDWNDFMVVVCRSGFRLFTFDRWSTFVVCC